jgi:hypothetical protein
MISLRNLSASMPSTRAASARRLREVAQARVVAGHWGFRRCRRAGSRSQAAIRRIDMRCEGAVERHPRPAPGVLPRASCGLPSRVGGPRPAHRGRGRARCPTGAKHATPDCRRSRRRAKPPPRTRRDRRGARRGRRAEAQLPRRRLRGTAQSGFSEQDEAPIVNEFAQLRSVYGAREHRRLIHKKPVVGILAGGSPKARPRIPPRRLRSLRHAETVTLSAKGGVGHSPATQGCGPLILPP